MADIVIYSSKEKETIKQEIAGKYLSVIFDGTTRVGEAMAIIVRYVESEWSIEQRLIRLQLLQKNMSGEEIARVLIDTLSREYAIPPSFLLASMRDCASSNNVAVTILKVVFPQLLDVGCFSHTLDHVGDKFCVPQKKALLEVELAVIVDLGVHFVKATYHLEGDGPLAFRCHDAITTLTTAVNLAYYPNLNAIARELCGGNHAAQQQLVNYGQSRIQPGIPHYRERLNDSMMVPLKALKLPDFSYYQKFRRCNLTHLLWMN